ncbi:hypothetical protein D9619_011957 [Psilocybe cf. subviscida]|uniref:NACHT domain-containing protein n=1 Tax=Psilocybe cf. subviscida TaxID=2480587 RepID=A0A8H5B0X7_9AGAR|nr:hypothetical protein D9619_011957 [Psilocybe cf. subviscida]
MSRATLKPAAQKMLTLVRDNYSLAKDSFRTALIYSAIGNWLMEDSKLIDARSFVTAKTHSQLPSRLVLLFAVRCSHCRLPHMAQDRSLRLLTASTGTTKKNSRVRWARLGQGREDIDWGPASRLMTRAHGLEKRVHSIPSRTISFQVYKLHLSLTLPYMSQSTSGKSGTQNGDGVSMFRDASNINFHNSTLITNGSRGTDKKKKITDAMALLGSRAEKGAPYDAGAREDVPNVMNTPGALPLMWMYGPAGSGKTTIMQTVAETFDKEGTLATSFFFSRLSAARPRDKQNFVITMAHQLSLSIPALQQPLVDTLSDPSILSKSLVKQLDSLIINPLRALNPAQVGPLCIFMVDGLDECNNDAAQRDVLDLLERLLDQTPHRVRILVASRSLSHIQSFFVRASIRERIQTTPLDNDYQSDMDIHRYFVSKSEGIRGDHPARSELPFEWPSHSDIDVLVKRASGQFIYASVVMKFIADHGRHPDESLQTIIRSKASSNARPYEELDAIYAQVLSTIEPQNLEFVYALMGCLILDEYRYCFAKVAQNQGTAQIDSLFSIPAGTTASRTNRIYPLITVGSKGGMKFSHASFPEYLLDRSRSKNFFLDMQKVH